MPMVSFQNEKHDKNYVSKRKSGGGEQNSERMKNNGGKKQ